MAGASAFAIGGCACPFGCQKIKLAAVGIWGKGFSDWLPMYESGLVEIVAFCDPDLDAYGKVAAGLRKKNVALDISRIPYYTDYRKLLADADMLGIEAMTVSTPDHAHAAIAIQAMKRGIHVYVQKPLVRTLWELDYFRKTAKAHGVVTQMGNQGSGVTGFRRGTDILRSGILGDVREVHVWTNRPVWPQGLLAKETTLGPADKIPRDFDWDAWLGVAKDRPFKGAYPHGKKGYDPWNLCGGIYHPFSWRGFFDFGCGAFGDMACHTMNLPFRGLELGAVTKAECTFIEEKNDVAFPLKSTVCLTYAARSSAYQAGKNLPELKLYWYEGCQLPSADLMPQVVATLGSVPKEGLFIRGDKGVLISTNAYGGKSMIALNGEKKVVDIWEHEAAKAVAQVTPYRPEGSGGSEKSAGAAAVKADGHYIEFLDAIRGEGPVFADTHSRCFADVDYSIPIMEGILCGVVAQQVDGPIAWNSREQKFDSAAANMLMKPYVRRGWEF